jgi:hypothetical protein
MDIPQQIEEVRAKILEMGLAGASENMIAGQEERLSKLLELLNSQDEL